MTFQPLYSADEVQRLVRSMARNIAHDHPDGVVVVGVLKAAVVLAADLVRELGRASRGDIRLDFLQTSSFRADSGRVRLVQDLREDIGGRPVVLVTTLIDTGLRTAYLRGQLAQREPSSLRLATLFDKTARRILPLEIDYVGATVPDRFLVGYGLDALGQGRHIGGVATLAGEDELASAALAEWIRDDHFGARRVLSEPPAER